MIQANELRIGNFIIGSDYFEFGKVLEIKQGDKIDDCDYVILYEGFGKNNNPDLFKEAGHIEPEMVFGDVKEFEPIPLTEEWLLKFGFVSSMFEDNVFIHYNGMKYFLETQQLHFLTIELNCKYVHILQNIYFALTGEELTIKE